jgi:hypothetical protein
VTKMEKAKDVIANLEKEALWAKVCLCWQGCSGECVKRNMVIIVGHS